MGLPIKKSDHKYTYSEFCQWPGDERWELIDGVAFNMRGETCSLEQGNNPNEERYRKGKRFPAPSTRHQEISFELAGLLREYLKSNRCRAFSAPFDVYFPDSSDQDINDVSNIVQPDLSVICNSSKIFKKGCFGAPDLIMEILSPSTSMKDLNEKFHLYENNGVREYWIVDPGNAYIRVFLLDREGDINKYDYGTLIPSVDFHDTNTIAKSIVLEGFIVDISELFSI